MVAKIVHGQKKGATKSKYLGCNRQQVEIAVRNGNAKVMLAAETKRYVCRLLSFSV